MTNYLTLDDISTAELVDRIFIGIDPGVNGGIAVIDVQDGIEVVHSHRYPKRVEDAAILFKDLVPSNIDNVVLYIEHVHSMPKQGVKSMFTFGQNLGQWEGIIASHEIRPIYISPRKWIDFYNVGKGLQRKDRKRKLRNTAEKIFPNVNMTYNISDALLIAHYGKIKYYEDFYGVEQQSEWQVG
tara:strand:+ start:2724 stop:3275 length:552 start_codon:yes stop_codon:yes gene_type:complete